MNVIIFHGTGSSPEQFWFSWLKHSLERKNNNVFLPQLPNANNPSVAGWLPFALLNGKYDEQTVLVGHSAGCALILSVLENIRVRVSKVILVAGFAYPLDPKVEQPIIQKNYNWERIKEHFSSLIIINSDNDPWGCNDKAGKYIFDNLDH